MSPDAPRRLVVAVTGASGMPYARRLLETLIGAGVEVHLVVTTAGRLTWAEEIGGEFPGDLPDGPGELILHQERNVGAGPASGSFRHHGMLVCPCSMRTLAAVAAGLADNLVTRAADVTLKERRRLVLVTRETPLNLIHIENMARVTRAGGIVMPAEPGFYHRPSTLEELVDFVVQRALDAVGIEAELAPRWKTP